MPTWHPQSEKFVKEVIGAEAFKEEAAKLFAKVTFDFPREREKTDKFLLEFRIKYKVRQMPSVVLLDSAGKPYGFAGLMRGGAEEFWTEIKRLVDERVKRDELFAKAKTLKGVESAKLMVEGLELMPSQVIRDFYVLALNDIAREDKEGKTGYIAKIEKAEALKREQAYYQALFREKKYDEVIKVATKAAQEAAGEDAQRISLYKIQAMATLEQYEQAKSAIDAMAYLSPYPSYLFQRLPFYFDPRIGFFLIKKAIQVLQPFIIRL